MKALTYIEHDKFAMIDKQKPTLQNPQDAIVRVTMSSICTSDLHIKHGSVPRAVPGITVGHEMVGIVEQIGDEVMSVCPGDRVTVNVETFCGGCFFCKHGYVNNCTDQMEAGRLDAGSTADRQNMSGCRLPTKAEPDSGQCDGRTGTLCRDILATGFWAARISEIQPEDTVLIIGAGPTGICTLLCAMLQNPKAIIVCEKEEERRLFLRKHYPKVLACTPEECEAYVLAHSEHGGADVVIEAAGTKDTFELAWKCARPNAIVTVVALYEEAQILPLPQMYGKNLTFKTGGVDGCDCG